VAPARPEGKRRGLLALAAVSPFAWAMFMIKPAAAQNGPASGSGLFDEVTAKVLPQKGFQSKIRLGASVAKLVGKDVIDRQKFEALYKDRTSLPPELQSALGAPSLEPILLTRGNDRPRFTSRPSRTPIGKRSIPGRSWASIIPPSARGRKMCRPKWRKYRICCRGQAMRLAAYKDRAS